MAPFHVVVTLAMAACGIGALFGEIRGNGNLLWLSFFTGYWVTLAAIVTGFVLVIVLIYRAFRRNARPLFLRSWLGVANGVVALVFWVWFMFDNMPANHSLQTDRFPAAELRR